MAKPPPIELPDMSVPQTAEALNVSRNHVWNMIRDGRLPAYKVGNVVRLKRSDIEASVQPVAASRD